MIGTHRAAGGPAALNDAAEYARTLAWDEQLDAKLAALTLDQINAAFRAHVNTAGISIVKGGDFKAAKVYQ
jgi:zinc protease